jgi:hypothetical protein
MDKEIIALIAERCSEITRKHPNSNLTITVSMPTSATVYYPVFVVNETTLSSASDNSPVTRVKIV